MNKDFINKQEIKLQKIKDDLTKELSQFAEKDPNIEGNWKTKFPEYDGMESGGSRLETAQDEVEDYIGKLSLEHSMELRLKDIDEALGSIKKDQYGICEKCEKKITMDRLEAKPEARNCKNCI
jgi:RNA polymerase-binding transcription factor DksA